MPGQRDGMSVTAETGKADRTGVFRRHVLYIPCLLYTSDAADERSSVDLGGRRIIKKKKICAVGRCLLTPEKISINNTH